jgi:hypothetical protein
MLFWIPTGTLQPARDASIQLWWYRRNKCCKFLPIDGVRILFLLYNFGLMIMLQFLPIDGGRILFFFWTARLEFWYFLNRAPRERHLGVKIIELPCFNWTLWALNSEKRMTLAFQSVCKDSFVSNDEKSK